MLHLWLLSAKLLPCFKVLSAQLVCFAFMSGSGGGFDGHDKGWYYGTTLTGEEGFRMWSERQYAGRNLSSQFAKHGAPTFRDPVYFHQNPMG